MATNACDVNQLDSDSLLPPRKRLLAGFKKQNSNSNGSPSSPFLHTFASSSSTSNSNGSSASADVQIHLDHLLASHNNDQNQSPEEVAEASKIAAALAARVAKAARAMADEKARIAAKAVATAKSALELVASFPNEALTTSAVYKERSPRKNKQKKHVPVQLLYSKDHLKENYTAMDEDLTQRLHRAINNSPRVSRTCSGSEFKGHRNNKRQKSLVTYENTTVTTAATTMYDGHDIAGVVDSDTSNDEVERTRTNEKLFLSDKVVSENGDSTSNPPLKEKAGDEGTLMGKRRGRVKLKKLPLSICTSKDQGNGSATKTTAQSPLPVTNPPESSNGGVTPVMAGKSWKCQDLKSPECVKQNKAVRS